MNRKALDRLREVGSHLDAENYPRVFNGGVVAPSDPPIAKSTLGAEKRYDHQGTNRPAAGAWQWTAPRQRQARRYRSSDHAAPVVSNLLRRAYIDQLDAVASAYPSARCWQQREGLWLSVQSALIADSDRRATFVVAIPFVEGAIPKAWGFWTTAISFDWIGPRHTNFPDGSICAFEPRDQTWMGGDSIVALLDLYTLWAVRHLHLNLVGRWPGRQSVSHAYERIREIRDDEYCGCDRASRFYADCCKQADFGEDHRLLAADFLAKHAGWLMRQPPARIARFLVERRDPPTLTELLV